MGRHPPESSPRNRKTRRGGSTCDRVDSPVPFPLGRHGRDRNRHTGRPSTFPEFPMHSACNQLPSAVKSVRLGNITAEVVMTVGDVELVAAITRGSAEALGLKEGAR